MDNVLIEGFKYVIFLCIG